ncbi:small G protein signaling modulator 2 isoform X1 [Acyrthosiphon pisum]|uniref:Small G protein signaling modulator 2 n=1 Tax=Acyrthosiphon pisum TaxID=7029 RepID=A0A8R2B1B4_ACYPI|nr:small G protein signaling modulator 2 isoform X1 [Acyrthosiphon pisum]|eukprot:XP_008179493.1 PREDICTED: small G protein signaling modulator 2 isoform X1 [Acyrthosiphon pisum]
MDSNNTSKKFKEQLIKNVKKEVKQIMEEAVTRKFVHEESGSITSLCAAVEACLSQGLRRRALGLFKTSSTTALLHKMAKNFEPASIISQKVQEMENTDPNKPITIRRDSMASPRICPCILNRRGSLTWLLFNNEKSVVVSPFRRSSNLTPTQICTCTLNRRSSLTWLLFGNDNSDSCATRAASVNSTLTSSITLPNVHPPPLTKKNSAGSGLGPTSITLPKYLWIRLALFEKLLAVIIDHLVQNCSKYYEKDSLVADPDYGSILSSLLVGPCALDYSRTKSHDQFWTDPPADELVQRHRISSGYHTSPPCRTPINYRRNLHATSNDDNQRQTPISAKDYVESLHQNNRVTLLYGKNNVLVLPKDVTEPMAGYLSLHQTASSLIIKWTPNQLMNCHSPGTNQNDHPEIDASDKSQYWDYAMNVNVDEIVYVHCHQQGNDNGGTIVLVAQDGVQQPPIHFPQGGHLLAFLTCLENGLLPHGQLDPPLWPQRGKGKVFPKLRRKGRSQIQDISNDLSSNTEESRDYVFQIISKARHEEFLSRGEEILDSKIWSMPSAANNMLNRVRGHLESSSTNSSTSTSSSLDPVASPLLINIQNTSKDTGDSLQILCETMKKQIISRAFYGWLAYCRHLTTVRTHLSGLVNTVIIDSSDAETGLTKEKWYSFKNDSNLVNDDTKLEIFRLTYFGGVQHDIRKEVWPFLLGHYTFGSTVEERNAVDLHCKQEYETTMSEWMAVEAIIRQKDRETMAANLAKLSSESTSGGDAPPPTPNTSKVLSQELSNDVFEDNINFSSDEDNPPVVDDTQLEHNAEFCDNPTKQTNTKKHIENIPKEIDCDKKSLSSDEGLGKDEVTEKDMTIKKNTSEDTSLYCPTSVIVTTNISQEKTMENPNDENEKIDSKDNNTSKLAVDENEGVGGSNHEQRSACISPASSQGGIYPVELVENFGLNVHRIDKDVQRCDRNYPYFTLENLDKLRNIICTYVWDHLEMGYMQGMCDLVAPLLVILDDETLSYSCFCLLMERMSANFPHSGGAMDTHFANMRSLVQILDSEMFELMHENGDFTHFYFCYRWFLLDFKRELLYDDVFTVWETIWAAKEMSSSHFVLFFALALVETYRDIILANHMDFTDIIKFFNEMAEHHDAKTVLSLARNLVLQLQTLIENK